MKTKLIVAALALLMTSGVAMAQSHDAITQRHQRISNGLAVAPYPGGPTIGACQVAAIEAYRHSGLTPAEAKARASGDFTEAEWQAGMDAMNNTEHKTSFSFTQAECVEIFRKQADIDNLLEQDRERERH
jgi:hypothetical protein